MKRLAVIGTGIAGLGCAYFLQSHYDMTLYEQNDYIGGHTNTIDVQENDKMVPIDTGFMVFNPVTYPNLVRLFQELNVPAKKTDMSFSVRHSGLNLEWNGAGLNKLFGQRKNLFNPRFWKMLGQLDRFNKEAVENLENPKYASYSVLDYVEERGYGLDFLELYMTPMSSAIWSTAPEKTLGFPVQALLRFFFNHGFLGLRTHHQWYTVDGGAKVYVQKLIAPFQEKIRLNMPVRKVLRLENGPVQVSTDQGSEVYDIVILACHADQTLLMLENPEPLEQELLSKFQYESNLALLHTDQSVMPKTRRCWAAWNYQVKNFNGNQKESRDLTAYRSATHYWMNRLQGVSEQQQYFVSLNAEDWIAPETVIETIQYQHPIYTVGALKAQAQLPLLNRKSPEQSVYFCGSYFKYGFHEDAFTSALELARTITGEPLWA